MAGTCGQRERNMDQREPLVMDANSLIALWITDAEEARDETGVLSGVLSYAGLPFTVAFYTDGWHLWARRA